MPDKYKIGVIGATGRGNYGHGIDTVWREFGNCEIVGVADADEAGRAEAVKRLKAPQAFADYRKLLDETKPDIVAVCPRWPDQHRDMVVACAERGMHVYTEKPLCRTLAEADEMVAALEKQKAKLAIAHQTRYSPKLPVIRELIDDGQLGTILELRGRGKEDKRGGGEDLWVLGSHIFNLMQYFGGEPNWCFATVMQGDRPTTKADVKPGAEGIGPLAGDNLAAMYGFDGGVTGYFGSRKEMNAGGSRFALQIYGSKGIVEILTGHLPAAWFIADPNWSAGRSKATWQPISSAGVGKPEPLKEGGLDAGNVLAVADLLKAIEEDRQPECNIYEARNTIEMISGVFESHRQKKPVSIPLENRKNALEMLA
jgi:predicted dehydrogenase